MFVATTINIMNPNKTLTKSFTIIELLNNRSCFVSNCL